jgi:hypothetical protein
LATPHAPLLLHLQGSVKSLPRPPHLLPSVSPPSKPHPLIAIDGYTRAPPLPSSAYKRRTQACLTPCHSPLSLPCLTLPLLTLAHAAVVLLGLVVDPSLRAPLIDLDRRQSFASGQESPPAPFPLTLSPMGVIARRSNLAARRHHASALLAETPRRAPHLVSCHPLSLPLQTAH